MSSTDIGIRQGAGNIGPRDDRPLNEQEIVQVQRLLSDPFSFPIQFKTWLVSYLETSDMTLPMSAILGLQALLGVTGAGSGALGILPAGIILPYGGGSPPVGAFLCNGGAYSKTQEARLYAAIGITYGGTSGGTTFNVPDLQGRIPAGLGSNADVNALGKNEGQAVGGRSPRHAHTFAQTPKGFSSQGVVIGSDTNVHTGNAMDYTEVGVHSHISSVGVGAQTDAPAYVVVNFIIVK